jgi:tetratricopeptide (TPR) repeat protein
MLRSFALITILCTSAQAADTAAPALEKALHHLYNFDFRSTHEVLDKIIQAHPEDPLPYAFRSSAFLFYELDRLQLLEAEFLTDDEKLVEKKKKLDPDPTVRANFLKALDEATKRGEAALRVNPNDKNALFSLCIAQGVTTDYMALVEKKQIGSLGPAKKSNNYAQQLLKIDPKFYDAYLTAGFSEYMLGSLPFFVRWFVRFDNVSGSKERGIENLRLTAREGHYFKAFAKILISLISLREKKPQEAQKLLAELAREYPSNPLFRKELVKLSQKLGMVAN